MNWLGDLEGLIERVVAGGEVTDEEVQSVRWVTDDPTVDRAANNAWLALRRFADDADIRARDKDYERMLRDALASRHDDLKAIRQ